MDFTHQQLQTLKEGFAREAMRNASVDRSSKRPRITKTSYEKVDIASQEYSNYPTSHKRAPMCSCKESRKYVVIFGRKMYISPRDIDMYKDFTIYTEE